MQLHNMVNIISSDNIISHYRNPISKMVSYLHPGIPSISNFIILNGRLGNKTDNQPHSIRIVHTDIFNQIIFNQIFLTQIGFGL